MKNVKRFMKNVKCTLGFGWILSSSIQFIMQDPLTSKNIGKVLLGQKTSPLCFLSWSSSSLNGYFDYIK